jgi:AraC-like DNA-binding protein
MNSHLDCLEATLPTVSLSRVLGTGSSWGILILGGRCHGNHPDTSGWHRQKFFALNLLLRGRGQFTDSSGRRHPVLPGTLYHHLPRTKARIQIDPASNAAEIFVIFDMETYRGLKLLHIIPEHEILTTGAPGLALQDFLRLRETCARSHRDISRRILISRLALFLSTLYERAFQRPGKGFWDQIIATATRRLESNLSDRLHLPDLARELHVAYPTFRKNFRRLVGVSPAEYRIRMRIQEACRLLAHHTVKETADRLAYCDPFTFSNQFRKHTGSSPSAFQKTLYQGRSA